MPAHDKYSDGNTDNSKTHRRNISQIFRSEEKWVGSKIFHKQTINREEKNDPEYKQHLVPPEMKENQLYRQGKIKTAEPRFHEMNDDLFSSDQ